MLTLITALALALAGIYALMLILAYAVPIDWDKLAKIAAA